ncbi:hypothetical protein D3C81_2161180 [compost metagenome]
MPPDDRRLLEERLAIREVLQQFLQQRLVDQHLLQVRGQQSRCGVERPSDDAKALFTPHHLIQVELYLEFRFDGGAKARLGEVVERQQAAQ